MSAVAVEAPPQQRIKVGLIVSPAIDAQAVEEIRDELVLGLSALWPGSVWEVDLVRDELAPPPVHLTDLVEAARDRLLAENWDYTVAITDLPIRYSRRLLRSHVSPTHGVALVSLPALGVIQRRRRLLGAVTDAMAALMGDEADVRSRTGRLRLLFGMVVANHPWRLTSRLGRAMLGALAAAVFALVTADVWRMATSVGPLRLVIVGLASLAAAATTLIVVHELWEHAPDPRVRDQVALFNLATLATVTIGVGALYLGIFLVTLLAAALMIDSSLLSKAIGHHSNAWDYVRLAWLASAVATIGGALGATVETDEAVREAAYAYRPEGQRSHA